MINPTPAPLPPVETAPTTKIPWYLWFIGVVAAILLIGALLRVLTPPPQAPENAPNRWNTLVPGYSTLSQASETLGQPLSSERTSEGVEYRFQSPSQNFPHEVVTNSQGTIKFMKQYLSYKDEVYLSQYVDQYGPANLVLKDEGSRSSLDAHVFLAQGIVVLAHVTGGSIEQIWYFEPTTEAEFLASWGKSLVGEENLEEEAFTPAGEDPNP